MRRYVLTTLLMSGLLFGLAACGVSSTGTTVANSKNGSTTISTSSSTGAPTGSNAATLEDSVINAIQKVQPAVVEITVTTTQGQALGSGSILTTDGYVLTNDHVVQGATAIQVSTSTTTYSAKVAGKDPADDLAVIKIENASNLPTITFADSSKLRVGQFVVAVGNPLGVGQSASFGIISALNRSVSEAPSGPANIIPNAIQTSAPINPGNSGGALIDLSGNLVGIPTLGALDPEFGNSPANGIGFAIPANRAQFIAEQIIKNGVVTNTGRAFLGVLTSDANGGAFIRQLVAGGPAEQAGLQPNDTIIQIDTTAIPNSAALGSYLANKAPGDKVTVTVNRNGTDLKITVTLGTLPAGT